MTRRGASSHDRPVQERLLEGLNDAQRRAVEHRGSPLIVLAGPGSGKTRVITSRIAHLLAGEDGGVEPESVVALTFTIKAAEEMRRRLRDLVGVSKADRLNALTFHALGMRILQRFGDTLRNPVLPAELRGFDLRSLPLPGRSWGGGAAWSGPSLTRGGLMDSAQRRRILRALILRGGFLKAHRAQGLDDAVELAVGQIGIMGEHAIEPLTALEFAGRWRDGLARGQLPGELAGDGRQPGKTNKPAGAGQGEAERQSALRASAEELETFADVARVYVLYDAALRQAGLVSFADLVTLPIRLLRQEPSPARTILHAEWRHYVVDEFQDVNPAQIELLRALAPPAEGQGRSAGGPDLCVVGDDDQSIYAFRGADERAFAHFARVWGGERVHLTENYRSTRAIVEVAQGVIARAESRFAPDKALRAMGQETEENAGVVGLRLEQESQGALAIASLVRAWSSAKLKPAAGAGADGAPTFAVITRTNKEAQRLSLSLVLEGLRVKTTVGRSNAEDAGVIDVLSWVHWLVDPGATHAAARVLARPPMGVEIEGIARAGRLFEEQQEDAVAAGSTAAASTRTALPSYPAFLASEELARSVRGEVWAERLIAAGQSAHTLHEELSVYAREHTAEETIRRIIERTGIAHAELLSARDRSARVESLVALLRFSRSLQGRLDAPGNLASFWRYYHDLDEGDRSLEKSLDAESRIAGEEESDFGAGEQDSPRNDEGGGGEGGAVVHVLNAHKAKGLEFDVVFVPRIGATKGCYGGAGGGGGGQDSPGRGELPAGLVEFALPHLEHAPAADVSRAEERRVFYVACTRARRRLVLMAKRTKSRSKGEHYLQEIEDDAAASAHLSNLGVRDVLAMDPVGGGPDGEGLSAGVSGDMAGGEADESGDAGLELDLQDVFDRARRRARLAAAAALESCDRASIEPAELDRAIRRLTAAGVRMALIASIQPESRASGMGENRSAHAGDEPGEASGLSAAQRELLALAVGNDGADGDGAQIEKEALRLKAHARRIAPATADLLTPGVKGPLRLSYTQVYEYKRCPRCYYLKYVLGLEPPAQEREVVGQVVHASIELFTRRRRERDAGEMDAHAGEMPGLFEAGASSAGTENGLEELLAIGEEKVREALAGSGVSAAETLDVRERVAALLTRYMSVFDDPGAHVLEIEKLVRMPIDASWRERVNHSAAKPRRGKGAAGAPLDAIAFEDLGEGHILSAKIDRVDQITLADGTTGFRIIDYKTGQASKRLTEPDKRDLQLGIYALALGELFPLEAHDAGSAAGSAGHRGVAEYWLVSTGERGAIALEELDVDYCRREVLSCIAGIRAGRFEPSRKCEDGDCRVFTGI